MMIDFGRAEKYIRDRGFGFVSHTFSEHPTTQAFFHIRVVRKTHPELAQALNSTAMGDQAYFWYEYQASPKGREVVAVLNPQQVHQHHLEEVNVLVAAIKAQWLKIDGPLPQSVRRAATDLLPAKEVIELAERRKSLQAEEKLRQEQLLRLEAAKLQQAAQARAAQQQAQAIRLKAISDLRAEEQQIEEEEFLHLVAELSALGFTHSKQVSRHIVANRLGYKYRHISGVLEMESQGKAWDFNGGFPPEIYARLCQRLGLENQKSRAVPKRFTPYKDIL